MSEDNQDTSAVRPYPEFSVDAGILYQALSNVVNGLNTKRLVITISAEGDKVRVYGVDRSALGGSVSGVLAAFKADVSAEGIVRPDTNMLSKMVSKLPDGNVRVFPDDDLTYRRLCLETDRVRFKTRCYPIEELFAEAPGVPEGSQSFRMDTDSIARALTVSSACALDDDRNDTFKSTVSAVTGENGLQLMSCDGSRLVTVDVEGAALGHSGSEAVLPAATVAALGRAARASGASRVIYHDSGGEDNDENRIVLDMIGAEVSTRYFCPLHVKEYPDVRSKIPDWEPDEEHSDDVGILSLTATDLRNAVNRMRVLDTRGVALSLSSPDGISMTPSEETDGDVDEDLSGAYEGPEQRIILNKDYLGDVSSICDGDIITMRIPEAANELVLIRGSDSDSVLYGVLRMAERRT